MEQVCRNDCLIQMFDDSLVFMMFCDDDDDDCDLNVRIIVTNCRPFFRCCYMPHLTEHVAVSVTASPC